MALRERFPHIYLSSEKLLIDPKLVQVEKRHFEDSMRLIVPAARRGFLCQKINKTNIVF